MNVDPAGVVRAILPKDGRIDGVGLGKLAEDAGAVEKILALASKSNMETGSHSSCRWVISERDRYPCRKNHPT